MPYRVHIVVKSIVTKGQESGVKYTAQKFGAERKLIFVTFRFLCHVEEKNASWRTKIESGLHGITSMVF